MTCQSGNLLIRVCETNLKGIKLSPTADGHASDGVRGPHHGFHPVDEPNLDEWHKDQRDFEGTYDAVLELKPTTTKSIPKVERNQAGDLIGFRVVCGNHTDTTRYHSGDQSTAVSTTSYTPRQKDRIRVRPGCVIS